MGKQHHTEKTDLIHKINIMKEKLKESTAQIIAFKNRDEQMKEDLQATKGLQE